MNKEEILKAARKKIKRHINYLQRSKAKTDSRFFTENNATDDSGGTSFQYWKKSNEKDKVFIFGSELEKKPHNIVWVQ